MADDVEGNVTFHVDVARGVDRHSLTELTGGVVRSVSGWQ